MAHCELAHCELAHRVIPACERSAPNDIAPQRTSTRSGPRPVADLDSLSNRPPKGL